MANIQFCITKNELEWKLIEEAIKESSQNTKVAARYNKGYSQFIAKELSRVLKSINIDSNNTTQILHQKKHFEINISEENVAKIDLICHRLDCTPAALISQLILQPRISNKNTNETIQLLQK